MNQTFSIDNIQGEIIYHNRYDITVKGEIQNTVNGGIIHYEAPNPIDRLSSFSGSGLPFVNYQQAFDNTPNRGNIELSTNNYFSIDILMPNSYYVGLGTVLIPPSLFIKYHNGEKQVTVPIKVNQAVPYRSLTYPISLEHASRKNSLFYSGMWDLPVRTQEQILRDSGYPETFNRQPQHKSIPVNFWGAKPPV